MTLKHRDNVFNFPKRCDHGSLLLLNLREQYSKENCFGKKMLKGSHHVVPEALQFGSVESLSRVQLLPTPWTAARQASLSITNSRSLLKLRSIESVMPSNHLILCHPLLLSPSILPCIRVFSNDSALHIR